MRNGDMMDKYFDHRDAINNLKASLFDIYEEQEKIIGAAPEEKRAQYLDNFINIKNLALQLVVEIEKLYDVNYTEKTENDNENLESSQSPHKNEEISNNNIVESDDTELESNDTNNISNNDGKYYLQCEESSLPTAAASLSVLEKLRNHNLNSSSNIDSDDNEIEFNDEENIASDNFNEEISTDSIDNTDDIVTSDDSNNQDYEEDDNISEVSDNPDNVGKNIILKLDSKDEKTRGIIVRNDQYMKLALSKHRQEGVLEEAKQFRINEAKRKREQLINEEKEDE